MIKSKLIHNSQASLSIDEAKEILESFNPLNDEYVSCADDLKDFKSGDIFVYYCDDKKRYTHPKKF